MYVDPEPAHTQRTGYNQTKLKLAACSHLLGKRVCVCPWREVYVHDCVTWNCPVVYVSEMFPEHVLELVEDPEVHVNGYSQLHLLLYLVCV